MRVLTVRQPWEALIFLGRKSWENRSPTSTVARQAKKLIGERVAIHAGLAYSEAATGCTAPDGKAWPIGQLIYGHIRCTAVVTRVVGSFAELDDPWRIAGDVGIRLEQILKFAPIRHRGGLGWRVLERADPGALRAIVESDAA